MGKKINVAELLKDCPTGMELDCTCADNVVFDKIIEYEQIKCVIGECRDPLILDKYGRLLHICCSKCVIFPKDETTWEGFVSPCKFKDGDVVATATGSWIGITTGGANDTFIPTYCVIKIGGEFEAYFGKKEKRNFDRLATEEEKQKLFQAIKDNGYRWNFHAKRLEKMIIPIFKKGDKVRVKNGVSEPRIIEDVCDRFYTLVPIGKIDFTDQDNWELVPNKFDITTLKPFDKVLVRDNNTMEWDISFFSHCNGLEFYKYSCLNGNGYAQCIPYEENKHLLGKTNKCDEFYMLWEE